MNKIIIARNLRNGIGAVIASALCVGITGLPFVDSGSNATITKVGFDQADLNPRIEDADTVLRAPSFGPGADSVSTTHKCADESFSCAVAKLNDPALFAVQRTDIGKSFSTGVARYGDTLQAALAKNADPRS